MPAHTRPDFEVTAIIISDRADHIVVAVEINKELIRRHTRLLENLLAIATREPPPGH
jgi:hypothetical protein